MTLQEMREAREKFRLELVDMQKSVAEARSAGKSGADLWAPDQQKKYETVSAEYAKLGESIDAEERAVDLQKHLELAGEQRNSQTRHGRPDPSLDDPIPGNHAGASYGEFFKDRDAARQHAKLEERNAYIFHAWALEGRHEDLMTDRHRQHMADAKLPHGLPKSMNLLGHDHSTSMALRDIMHGDNTAEARNRAYNHLSRLEGRSTLWAANEASFIPTTFRDAFEIAFHGYGGILGICDELITDSAEGLPWPFADDYANEGFQIDESAGTPIATAGADPLLSVPTLRAYDFSSGFAKISKTLLANSPFDLAAMLATVLAERIVKAIERKMVAGDGTNTIRGFPNRSVSATTFPLATLSLAKLQALIFSVISEHRDKGTLVMHDATVAGFAALAETTGAPLLNFGNGRLQIGKDVSYPYKVNNYLPAYGAPFVAAEKCIFFGNFKQYKVRIVRAIRLERMTERFAEFNLAAFVAARSADADLLRSTQTANNPVKHLTAA